MCACRARRPRRSRSIWSNAARTNACQCRRDAGWPCKRGPHRALAVRFRRSHHAPCPWPFARGGGARASRPPGRRSSSSSQCGSTAATAPRRGRPQACRPTAVDGAPTALVRAAWPPGRPAGCRGARRRRAHLCWHTRLPNASAAAHRRRPSLRRWPVCARSRGAPDRQCKAVSTTRSTSLCVWSSKCGRSDCESRSGRARAHLNTPPTAVLLRGHRACRRGDLSADLATSPSHNTRPRIVQPRPLDRNRRIRCSSLRSHARPRAPHTTGRTTPSSALSPGPAPENGW